MEQLLTVKEASRWASQRLQRLVTPSNISYLIGYGRIEKIERLGRTLVATQDLERYYNGNISQKIHARQFEGKNYGRKLEKKFLPLYENLLSKYKLKIKNAAQDRFLDRWFLSPIKREILLAKTLIDDIEDKDTRQLLQLVLSRTMRSCRATTHSDLATLRVQVYSPYYCHKHGRICKPLFSILGWWKRYTLDTLQRLKIYQQLRKPSYQYCLTGDAREIAVESTLQTAHPSLAKILSEKKVRGIFSSPPYVGLIDYHEQHAYAYDVFGLPRNDTNEIGALSNGQGHEARKAYKQSIVKVLKNTRSVMSEDCRIFLVVNDKYNLYSAVAEESGLMIVKQHKRPVLNRSEGNKGAYFESIFQMQQA